MTASLELKYLNLLEEAYEHGVAIFNKRTGKNTYTLPPRVLQWDLRELKTDKGYDVGLATTRPLNPSFMAAEIIGYYRGYDNIADFEKLGTKTLTANATKDPAWINNPHRKCDGDIGHTYGVVGRNYPSMTHGTIDLPTKVIRNLRDGIDDRCEIVSWLDLGNTDRAMLRPCMHSYQFTLIDGVLHVSVTQRSCDIPLGGRANMVQINKVLIAMSAITGHEPATVTWTINNPHIYEDQYDAVPEELSRVSGLPIYMEFTPAVDLTKVPAETTWDYISPGDFVFHDREVIQDPRPIRYMFTTAANTLFLK